MTEKIINTQTGEVTTRQVEPPIIPIESIQAQKLNELRQIVSLTRKNGMPFTFDNLDYHMQTEAKDIANWTSALVRLYRIPDTSLTHWVRVLENVVIYPTVGECIELMEQAQDYYYATIKANGNIENAINNETDKATLEAYNVQEAFQQALNNIL